MSWKMRLRFPPVPKSFYREKDVPREVEAYRPPLDYNELLKDMTLAKLQEIFEGILKRQEDKKDPVRSNFGRIEKDEVSVDQKAVYVEDFIRTHKRFSFRALLEKQHSKVEVIVTFLVVLELMKTGKITVEQASINDDIKKAHPHFIKVFDEYDNLNNSVQENVNASRVVKAFVRED